MLYTWPIIQLHAAAVDEDAQDSTACKNCCHMLTQHTLCALWHKASVHATPLLPACRQRHPLPAAAAAGWWQGPIKGDALLVGAGGITPLCGSQELLKGQQVGEGGPAGGQVGLDAAFTQEGGDAPQVPVVRGVRTVCQAGGGGGREGATADTQTKQQQARV